jgi:hypothetical protein
MVDKYNEQRLEWSLLESQIWNTLRRSPIQEEIMSKRTEELAFQTQNYLQ